MVEHVDNFLGHQISSKTVIDSTHLNFSYLGNENSHKIICFFDNFNLLRVTNQFIAYAGKLHFNLCGHCGGNPGYFSDCLAHIPQKKLTPEPRNFRGFYFFAQIHNILFAGKYLILRTENLQSRD
jgi:hypothetical protein